MKVISKCSIRTLTNENKPCKQYCVVASEDGMDTSLIIEKYILAEDDFETLEMLGFELRKEFKGKRLYYQIFAIKLNTLEHIVDWIGELNYNNMLK